jgi:hypothetical protein
MLPRLLEGDAVMARDEPSGLEGRPGPPNMRKLRCRATAGTVQFDQWGGGLAIVPCGTLLAPASEQRVESAGRQHTISSGRSAGHHMGIRLLRVEVASSIAQDRCC